MTSTTIGVVTSSRGYGGYLAAWADSLVRQRRRPDAVAILTHGDEGDAPLARDAARTLRAAGFHVKHKHLPGRVCFGTARNAAVAMVSTEWVMHLDADDLLLPHALETVERLAPTADVVALGYERFGDLNSGPKLRRKLYRANVGLEALDDPTPCSGVSPFRRSLWEQAPYRTDLMGGWDTALWLGFARLGARFVPTPEPAFLYRQHADSIFNARRLTTWPAARCGAKLQSIRRGDQGVAVLVPRATDDTGREAAWSWLQGWYAANFPTWDVRVGYASPVGWRKGTAVRNALEGCTADVVVVADADCVVSPAALEDAVARLRDGRAHWVVPHGTVYRLTEADTARYMAAGYAAPVAPPAGASFTRPPYVGVPGGGVLVVGRSDFETSGGIPDTFVGWGAEDEALAVILDALLGRHVRLDSPLVHLWHPPQPGYLRGDTYRANRERWRRLVAVADDPEAVWGMVQGGARRNLTSYTDARVRHQTTHTRARFVRDEVATMRDTFAERKLALQTLRGGPMGTALDLKRAHLRARKEQAERNEQSYATRGRRDDVRHDPDAVARSQKAMAGAPSNKMLDGSGTSNKGTGAPPADVKFASTQAEKAANDARLTDAELRELHAAAGPRGITLAQVRELSEGDGDDGDDAGDDETEG